VTARRIEGEASRGAAPALYVIGEPSGEPPDALAAQLDALPGAEPVLAVLPRADLAATVALMQRSPRVAGSFVADGAGAGGADGGGAGADGAGRGALAAAAARISADDLFGLEKVVAPGTRIHARTVSDHRDKTACLALVSYFAESAGVPRKLADPIAQCLDEMLMNALYDAPVDAAGAHIFADVPAKQRVELQSNQRVAVQYAHDGKRFAIAVRDAFGSLRRETVLAHLHKGLHAEDKVDSKAGGAGLGLFLMLHSASAVYFHVLPGIATEVVCVFELEAGPVGQLGFFVQRDPRGRRPSGPAKKRLAAALRRKRALVAGGFALAAVAATAAVWIATRTPSPPPLVELDTEPTGAEVAVDGVSVGSTPVSLTTLAPGATVSVAFRQTGYRAVTVRLTVPDPGERTRLVQPLAISDDLVRVRFVSSPPGAEVIRTGEASTTDRTYTPAELFVEAGKEQRFTLVMPKRVPLVIPPFTPARGAHGLEKGGALVPGATLRLEAPRAGTVTVGGAPHCVELAVPAACVLAPGSYDVEFRGDDGATVTRTVTMGAADATEVIPPPS
jgi:hypothetical protein